MTNGKRNRPNRKYRPREERDLTLMVVLTFFNIWSGTTTILGAMQILPLYLAWGIGGSVQLMLFLLQAGWAARHAPLRKWFAVMLLASASVYTSFFSYYGGLAKETNETRALARAVAANQKLVSEVYGPMRDHLRNLQEEALTLRVTAKAEKEKGISSGFVGYGEKAREYDRLALEKESEAESFARTVEELRPQFQYDLKGLTPEDILRKDGIALSVAPAEFRKNYPELERGAYIDEDLEMSLLAPYLKVKSREEAALLSLLIALGVDGMAIMLGTAIVIKSMPSEKRRSAFTTFARFIANSIGDLKESYATVDRATKESPQPLRYEDLDAAVEYVTLNLQGRGSDFLSDFYHAISETEPHIINVSELKSKYQKDEKIKTAIRTLIDKLTEPKRGWVERNNSNWVVARKHYHEVVNWLDNEIRRQSQLETQKQKQIGEDDWLFSENEQIPVQVKIPLNSNSRN